MICGACGRENAADARFCDVCGAPLEDVGADSARKVVTVVFTDVVDSTALGERLDPEALRGVMWRYFKVMQDTLERHGGTVEKFIGDAVMAVFGVPVVHEDDALRAVRAAFEASEALDRLNATLEVEHGIRILTRTGVNTGDVIVGGGLADQKLATGDAVNVAARLEQAAGPGEVLLGAATYGAVRDLVVVEPARLVSAKGKAEPVEAWRLVGLRPDVPAFARPIATPFVGRSGELEELRGAFATAVRERSCVVATVVGPPGIGKSRLAREFVASVSAEARVLVGRCVAYGEGITYLPLADVVRQVADDRAESEIARLLATVERGDAAARLVAGAVGSQGQAGAPDETAWAFRRLFETLAETRPLLLVLDDVHWAEATLLDLLEYVAAFSTGRPIMLLCLARPDLFDARPSWAAPRRHASIHPLAPLEPADAVTLVGSLADERNLPPALHERIVGTADGNPLFVEHMVAMLADSPDAAEESVPPTIHALLAARLDRLDPQELAVVQRAAVEGRLFHRGAVEALALRHDDRSVGTTLLSLARKELVRPDRSLHEGDDAFRFSHVLIRDVAYASLPKEARVDLHLRLAAWLQERAASGLTGQGELVGYHLEQAYRNAAELGRIDAAVRDAAGEAGRLLAEAGRLRLGLGDSASASALLRRAASLFEHDRRARVLLLPDLGRALREQGALDEADAVLAEAIEEARAVSDQPTELRAAMQRGQVAFMRAMVDPDELRAVALRALSVFEPIGSDADLADAWQLVGLAELAARNRTAQLEALLQARAHAIASGDLRRQTEAWNEVGGSMLFGRTPVAELVVFLEDELAWAREHDIPAVEADALLGGPYLLSRLGRFDEAREQCERSKEICRELGIAYGLSEAHVAGAELEELAGRLDLAERELRDGIAVVASIGAERYVALYRCRLAHVLLTVGKDAAAEAELESARASSDTFPRWQSARGRLLARQGRFDEAVRLAREAVAGVPLDDLTARARELTALAEVLRAHGDEAGALEALTEAVALHEEKGNIVPARQCRALLRSTDARARP